VKFLLKQNGIQFYLQIQKGNQIVQNQVITYSVFL